MSRTHAQWDDAALQHAFREPLPGSEAAADCPPAERLHDAAHGLLTADERTRVLEHVAICPACTVAWRVVAPARAARRAWSPVGAIAAAIAVVFLGAIAWRGLAPGRGPETTRAERGAPAPRIESLLARDADVSRASCVLRWTPVDGAVYDVVVSRESLTSLFHVEGLTRPEVTVPASALAPDASGGRLLWQVTARTPDGRRVQSATFTNVLR